MSQDSSSDAMLEECERSLTELAKLTATCAESMREWNPAKQDETGKRMYVRLTIFIV